MQGLPFIYELINAPSGVLTQKTYRLPINSTLFFAGISQRSEAGEQRQISVDAEIEIKPAGAPSTIIGMRLAQGQIWYVGADHFGFVSFTGPLPLKNERELELAFNIRNKYEADLKFWVYASFD